MKIDMSTFYQGQTVTKLHSNKNYVDTFTYFHIISNSLVILLFGATESEPLKPNH